MSPAVVTLTQLADELAAGHAAGGPRGLIGLAGAPGAGKSTIAAELSQALAERGVVAVAVPMDGFHLADSRLRHLGRLARKGAPDTSTATGI
jgi:pantothenate kinase